jgi:hypothetical protein
MRTSYCCSLIRSTSRPTASVLGAAVLLLFTLSSAGIAAAQPDTPPTPPPAAAPETPPAEPTQPKRVATRPNPRVALDRITDWDLFYREFRFAVARRDRDALKGCMVKNFLFTLEPVSDPDRRDAAFREWDRPEVRGWQQMERVLARGSRWDPLVPTLKVAPPEWVTNPRYVDYRLGFERQDGVWRWVWMMRGQ